MATTKFDIADYLDSEEMIAEYLNTVLENGESYKALSDGAKPQFGTIMKVLKAIGGQINVKPMTA